MIDRETATDAFLAAAGWRSAQREILPQDASSRHYVRLRRGDETAMLVDAPVDAPPCPADADEDERLALGWDATARLASGRVEAFAAISDHLRSLGLSSPRIIRMDIVTGLALIEDFGDMIMARLIEDGGDEAMLYVEAARAAAHLHRSPIPVETEHAGHVWPIPEFDRLALRACADLFIDHAPAPAGDAVRVRWEAERDALIEQILTFPRSFILRDYHAENIVWLEGRNGMERIGLLDFQDAISGWGEWDMAMLLQDARRRVSASARDAAIGVWLRETGTAHGDFERRMSAVGALNALRVTGVFARLVGAGKERYRRFQPRQRQLLAECLSRPGLGGMAELARHIAPDATS